MSAVFEEIEKPGEPAGESEIAALAFQAAAGNEAAFERLYRLHAGRIHALCARMTGDRARAEALTQEVFVRAWQKLGGFKGSGSFGGWLYRMGVRVVIEEQRKIARSARWLVEEPSFTRPDSDWRGGERAGRDAYAQALDSHPAPPSPSIEGALDLERAVAALPPGARLVFLLHDVEGYRHREIAEMAGTAIGTVKAQLHHARRRLREHLAEPREALS